VSCIFTVQSRNKWKLFVKTVRFPYVAEPLLASQKFYSMKSEFHKLRATKFFTATPNIFSIFTYFLQIFLLNKKLHQLTFSTQK
jgi:hypothetical protein